MFESVLAGAVLVCCGALLLRLLMPAARRQRLDQRLRLGGARLRHLATGLPSQWLQRRRTRREAHEVIDRARRRAAADARFQREGNVYRPDRFKPPADRDKLH